ARPQVAPEPHACARRGDERTLFSAARRDLALGRILETAAPGRSSIFLSASLPSRRPPPESWSSGGHLESSGAAACGRRRIDAERDQRTYVAKTARAIGGPLRHRRLVPAPDAVPAAHRRSVGRVDPSD